MIIKSIILIQDSVKTIDTSLYIMLLSRKYNHTVHVVVLYSSVEFGRLDQAVLIQKTYSQSICSAVGHHHLWLVSAF
jgi:hypothetical protein